MTLKEKIKEKDKEYKYTNDLRQSMLISLSSRFDKLIEEEVFMMSTLLDPNFGMNYFKDEHQDTVKARVLAILKRECASKQV